MNDAPSTGTTTPVSSDAPPATVGRVLRDQRRALFVALLMSVAGFWVAGPMGRWDVASLLAVGVLLGLVNHLATERSLLRVISSGEELTRARIAVAAMWRLAVTGVVAIALVVAFWSTGIVVLLGIALFRLVAIVMTSIPLLKELKA